MDNNNTLVAKDGSEDSECHTEEEIALQYKNIGNKHFIVKKFSEAINYYSLGLENNPRNLDLLSNRSAAYLELRCYKNAFFDLQKVLEFSADHSKANYRMIRALWGLGRYEEARCFIAEKVQIYPQLKKNKEVLKLMEKCESLIVQNSTGVYDMLQLFTLREDNTKILDIAEFTAQIEIKEIEGKGRGAIAVKDIKAGETVKCCRAFSIYYHSEKNETNLKGQEQLVQLIAEKIRLEPESSIPFYELFSGSELHSQTQNGIDAVDLNRINQIVKLNGFSRIDPEGKLLDCTGLWISSSYLNHSCSDANCWWDIFGDMMIFRAIRDISKGEELLVSYASTLLPFEKRKEVIASHEFICDCRMCLFEDEESEQGLQKRYEIVSALKMDIQKSLQQDKNLNISRIMKYVEQLDKMGEKHAKWNYHLAQPHITMLSQLMLKQGDRGSAIKLLEKAHFITKDSTNVDYSCIFAKSIIGLYFMQRELPQMMKWAMILKHDLMIAYGSLNPIKVLAPEIIEMLNCSGIDFFSEKI